MNKKQIIVLVLIVMISLTIYLTLNYSINKTTSMNNKKIYSKLKLDKCNGIYIGNLFYRNNEKMKKNYAIKDKKKIENILKFIRHAKIEIKNHTFKAYPPITHQLNFTIEGRMNTIFARYSLETNQLLILDEEFPDDIDKSGLFGKMIIFKLDSKFKESIKKN
ncbi:hypothetical protein Halha_0337 [Halobacteroides halobius DSM 5150]|uniref:Uncharacterized protein n=1 Tax=Halobacteroides halobius (strain ATCC 35273 / DSM 5150 / MD-1) TaxID=748449 RepID=L0K741_HALHC|nr:hypothetical protein [Halobacteroides halobius]AGB40345.1 hypothetical protein Halha_0337 [Halobacteroides halobius DSM 5150]